MDQTLLDPNLGGVYICANLLHENDSESSRDCDEWGGGGGEGGGGGGCGGGGGGGGGRVVVVDADGGDPVQLPAASRVVEAADPGRRGTSLATLTPCRLFLFLAVLT